MGTVGWASCRWGGRRKGRDSERRGQGRARNNPGRYVYRLPQRLTTVIMQGMDMFNGEQNLYKKPQALPRQRESSAAAVAQRLSEADRLKEMRRLRRQSGPSPGGGRARRLWQDAVGPQTRRSGKHVEEPAEAGKTRGRDGARAGESILAAYDDSERDSPTARKPKRTRWKSRRSKCMGAPPSCRASAGPGMKRA